MRRGNSRIIADRPRKPKHKATDIKKQITGLTQRRDKANVGEQYYIDTAEEPYTNRIIAFSPSLCDVWLGKYWPLL